MRLARKHCAGASQYANSCGNAMGLKLALVSVAALLAGCAADGTPLTLSTSSIDGKAEAVKVAKADPACAALMTRIDSLRKDGVAERLEKASAGKTSTVKVKRESLAQMAELDKANAEFQAKCSTVQPQQAAAVAPVATPATSPAPATSAAAAPVAQAKAAVADTAAKPVVAATEKAASQSVFATAPAKN